MGPLYGSPYLYGPYKLEQADLDLPQSDQNSSELIGEDSEGSSSSDDDDPGVSALVEDDN